MTLEELKQKAINRIKENTPVLKDRSDIEIMAMCHVRVEDYIAGAKENGEQLEQANEIIKKLLKTPQTVYKRDEDGEVCPYFNPDYEELKEQAEQFLKETEKWADQSI